ncbi:MAG: type II toxin-antitoxin system VapC family toxin [Firmicutes bacterium]|nr:type II toxin-antitoxin system VapC family toxin [Bacillota bacterium]
MTGADRVVLYWDASAIVSALFRDRYSSEALQWAAVEGLHLCSSLAWAEVHAVVARLQREAGLPDMLAESALQTLEAGPGRLLATAPDPDWIGRLAARWPLRGADLWHLAMAVTLRRELPALRMLTFDSRLYGAALGEGLAPEQAAASSPQP